MSPRRLLAGSMSPEAPGSLMAGRAALMAGATRVAPGSYVRAAAVAALRQGDDFWRRISTFELRGLPQLGHFYSDDEIKEIQTRALTERLVDMLRGEGQLANLKLWLPSPAQYDNDLSDYLPEDLVLSLIHI
eukprot:14108697-Heterocapsa_arctica.AAC.1